MQRIVLVVAAIVGLCAFLIQPMVSVDGKRLGWHLLTAQEVLMDADRHYEIPYPHFPMLIAEYGALTFVTICLYLAAGERRASST